MKEAGGVLTELVFVFGGLHGGVHRGRRGQSAARSREGGARDGIVSR